MSKINTENTDEKEKFMRLRDELLAVEADKIAGRIGCTLEELDDYLETIID